MIWGYNTALMALAVISAHLVNASGVVYPNQVATVPAKAATPGHDEGELHLFPVDTLVQFPVGTFVENIAVRPCGKLLVTILAGQLVQVDPNIPKSKPVIVHRFAANVTNVVEGEPDIFYVFSGVLDRQGTWALYKVDLSTFVADDVTGTVKKPAKVIEFVKIPEGRLLNGAAFLPRAQGFILVGDSALGVIYSINIRTRAVQIWTRDRLLTPLAFRETNLPLTAVNGLKVFNNFVYAANSWNAQFMRIATTAAGAPHGKWEILADNLVVDDFAIDEASGPGRGTAYLTTHIFSSVVSLTPQRVRSSVAGGPSDTIVAGTTSAAFGRTKADNRLLYITTDGGLFAPVDGRVGPGRILKMNIDQPTY